MKYLNLFQAQNITNNFNNIVIMTSLIFKFSDHIFDSSFQSSPF